MASQRASIEALFGNGDMPPAETIVEHDGLAQHEKASAEWFYGNKSWPQVLKEIRTLRENGLRTGAYLEPWAVLTREALSYYLRAYLEYLVETLASPEPDTEFMFDLFGALGLSIIIHRSSPFSPEQTAFLVQMAQSSAAAVNDVARFDGEDAHIKWSIDDFLLQLRTQGS
ncbi:MAG: hypothetical protein U0636_04085 [Phycisphaerales bacterium]